MAEEKEQPKKKGIFQEFKEFITRGNVIDLAVGVIIGGAFSAIVTALTSQILQPLINWVFSLTGTGKGLESAITMLSPAYDAEGALVLEESIYINWGAFISAIINFLLIAIVLFIVIKAINSARKAADEAKAKAEAKIKEKKSKKKDTEVEETLEETEE